MNKLPLSPTYYRIIDMLFQTKTINVPAYVTTIKGTSINRVNSHNITTINPVNQDGIIITDAQLYNKCTSAEWHLIGKISMELKQNNVLWKCDEKTKANGTSKKAIKGLLDKELLIKTETTDIYVVNPLFIRRGNFHNVMTTTADLLSNSSKVNDEHLVNKRAVKSFILPNSGN